MFTNIIKSAQERKSIICLYTDKDDSGKFSAGYVYKTNEQFVLVEHINQFGLYDGYILKSIGDVFLVEESNKYVQKLYILSNKNGQKHNSIPINDNDLLRSLLYYAKENKFVVSIQLVNSGFSDAQGFIKEIVGNSITISSITDFGEADGLAYFNLEDITHIICDSENEQALKILFEEL